MKIQVVSDLHLDHSTFCPHNLEGVEVLVVAGDVANLGFKKNHQLVSDFFNSVTTQYPHVVWVLGNHEFYGGSWNKTVESWKTWSRTNFDNLYLLEDSCVTIGDIDFLGSTLWTDLNKGCPITQNMVQNYMNDYHVIKYDGNCYRKLIPRDTMSRHLNSVDWLNHYSSTNKKVVITHHAPSRLSIHEMYKHDHYMNGGYCSDLENTVYTLDPVLWIHGHTHRSCSYQLHTTTVVCNPRGYGNENPQFDPQLVKTL